MDGAGSTTVWTYLICTLKNGHNSKSCFTTTKKLEIRNKWTSICYTKKHEWIPQNYYLVNKARY